MTDHNDPTSYDLTRHSDPNRVQFGTRPKTPEGLTITDNQYFSDFAIIADLLPGVVDNPSLGFAVNAKIQSVLMGVPEARTVGESLSQQKTLGQKLKEGTVNPKDIELVRGLIVAADRCKTLIGVLARATVIHYMKPNAVLMTHSNPTDSLSVGVLGSGVITTYPDSSNPDAKEERPSSLDVAYFPALLRQSYRNLNVPGIVVTYLGVKNVGEIFDLWEHFSVQPGASTPNNPQDLA